MIKSTINIFWFRRDLRIRDNVALHYALKSGLPVIPIFIFDTDILSKLEEKRDARLAFIHDCLSEINSELHNWDSSLFVYSGKPIEVFEKLSDQFDIHSVFVNNDYEPYAIARDEQVKALVNERGSEFRQFKDQVIFEKDDVLKPDGSPYTVYTPYMKKWKSHFHESMADAYTIEEHVSNFIRTDKKDIIALNELGFSKSSIKVPAYRLNQAVYSSYKEKRDIPSVDGTTHLSTHLRFGTMSIREVVRNVLNESETLLNEFIWREFFSQILWHFPHVEHGSFRKKYDFIDWRNNEEEFERWCQGKTGFPIVDAGMRELNETGLMHNRVRMITASFLIKDLLIDWRWGEAYFANKLLDFDLASNNGNWQWAAGTGCDAAPYFRVFNPTEQAKKFDPERIYINKWLPELESFDYPEPMVDHKFARERALKTYKAALAQTI